MIIMCGNNMKSDDKNTFSKFIQAGDFSDEKIEGILIHYNAPKKTLVNKTFKYLGEEIGVIKDKPFFENVITNAVELLILLCNSIDFQENEVIINRQRIKKYREALLVNANKFKNDKFMEAANKLDEIVLDKNINLEDLKQLLIRLINKKEDINIIKKLLNTNKGVLLVDKNILFDYIFNLSLKALKSYSHDIYYYIALLKIFYTSRINKGIYLERLNEASYNKNELVNEIYSIINGKKRSLTPEKIIEKYGIISDFTTPYIILPNDSFYNEDIITIDRGGTRLRDDGFGVIKDGNNYIVGIHIADPSYLIKPNSYEDLVARNNYKCIYLPDYSIRLLSPELENALTLDEGKPRNAMTMYVVIDNTGQIQDYYITENIIKVLTNLTYKRSNELFDCHDSYLSPMLENLYDVSCLLESLNTSKKDYLSKKEMNAFEKKIEESKSDKIVAEMMVLYNRLMPKIMCEGGVPYVYRIQDPSYLQSLVKKMGIKVDDSTLETIDSIYMDSKYSITPRYHNGLHLNIYSHSSNTLREYPSMYNIFLTHGFYFKDMKMDYDFEEFEKLVSYFNQRDVELSLMESEYVRALKLHKSK